MKIIRYILLSLAACSVLLVSCVKEAEINGVGGVDVSILIATGGNAQTRSGTHAGTGIDSEIGHFRVLIFDSKSGKLAHKFAFEPPATPQEINMKTGVYDFVLIANDNVDAVKTQLDDLTIGDSRIIDLNGLSFASTSFDDETRIPMVSVVRGVKVYPEGRIELPGRDDQNEGVWDGSTKIWSIELKRLAVRLDLKIKLTDGQTVDASKKLLIDKVPTCVYLIPGDNDEEYEDETRKYDVPPTAVGGDLIWERIILPESMFSEIADSEKGVQLLLTVNDVECTTVIGFDTSVPDYTLPRNTYLDIEATANPQQQALDCSATVVPWNDDPEQNVIVDEPYYLYVAADELLFTDAEGSAEITAETNYDLTEDKQGYPKGIQVSMEGGSGWITDLEAVTTDNKNYKIKFNVSELENLANRTAKIYVQAGNMRKVINVTQALWGGHADILYFDPTDCNRLKIGRWGDEISKDNYQERMVFTKFGGVVGFTIEGTIWDNNYVKFNPTVTTVTGYGNDNNDDQNTLPRVPGFPPTRYDNNYGPNISSTGVDGYHNYENIKKGRGDICQLVGLTAAEIQDASTQEAFDDLLAKRSAEYKGWRLPTARENASFVGGASNYSTWISWENGNSFYSYNPTTAGADSDIMKWPYYYNNDGHVVGDGSTGAAGTPNTGRFPVVSDAWSHAYSQVLPAAGNRVYTTGDAGNEGLFGTYGSSTPYNGESCYFLNAHNNTVYPVLNTWYSSGVAVRCVRPPMNNHLKY